MYWFKMYFYFIQAYMIDNNQEQNTCLKENKVKQQILKVI